MQIVDVKIEQIRPYWRNPRKNEKAIQAVKESIERYGFNVPIVLDMAGVIIAGHTRYKAALELGWKSIPCIYSDMDEKKAKEYRIADNKTGELAQWDMASLKLEMRELEFDGSLPGFDEAEMSSFLSDISFGNASLPSLDGSDKDQERFDRKEAELNSKFSDHSQKMQDNYVTVNCPHCGKEFVLDKNDMG
jgi:ParB family chromosome partitioning protein